MLGVHERNEACVCLCAVISHKARCTRRASRGLRAARSASVASLPIDVHHLPSRPWLLPYYRLYRSLHYTLEGCISRYERAGIDDVGHMHYRCVHLLFSPSTLHARNATDYEQASRICASVAFPVYRMRSCTDAWLKQASRVPARYATFGSTAPWASKTPFARVALNRSLVIPLFAFHRVRR